MSQAFRVMARLGLRVVLASGLWRLRGNNISHIKVRAHSSALLLIGIVGMLRPPPPLRRRPGQSFTGRTREETMRLR